MPDSSSGRTPRSQRVSRGSIPLSGTIRQVSPETNYSSGIETRWDNDANQHVPLRGPLTRSEG